MQRFCLHGLLLAASLCTILATRSAPITVAGTLDTSFNPSGLSITATGASVDFGGYPGSLIIDLGGREYGYGVDAINFVTQGDRILLGGRTNVGPAGSLNNFAVVALTATGMLDQSFNPSGFAITSTGAAIDVGGYPGSLIIDLGGSDLDFLLAAQEDRIILGGATNVGLSGSLNNFALVVLTSTGLLDSSFNPSGLTITPTGASVDLGGYAGSLIVDLGGNDIAFSVDQFAFFLQGDRIILGGETNTGPNPIGPPNPKNFALVVLTSTGLLDSSFNPSGLTITSTGASVDRGGYAGSLIVDLGGNDFGKSVDAFRFVPQGDRILLGGSTNTGAEGLPPLNNFAVLAVTTTGALDTSFNPSGLTITVTGASVDRGGYAGSLIIDLGEQDSATSLDTFKFATQGDRIVLAGQSNTGPAGFNFALVMLTPTGALDRSFNPSGLTILADGSSVDLGGYAGSLIIDLGGNAFVSSVDAYDFDDQGDRIIVAGFTTTGPALPYSYENNIALVVLTPIGTLDTAFNPSGLTILADGSSADLGGYAGSLIIDLGGNDYAHSVDAFNFMVQGERIILGGNTTTGAVTPYSANFALVALHGVTRFPIVPPIPLSPLAELPFIAMAAA